MKFKKYVPIVMIVSGGFILITTNIKNKQTDERQEDGKNKFGAEITLIEPLWGITEQWSDACRQAEISYLDMIEKGNSPQEARSVLPNSLKTEIVMTANLREWRHFFKLRTAKAAHPQMREITIPLLAELKTLIQIIFDDIEVKEYE